MHINQILLVENQVGSAFDIANQIKELYPECELRKTNTREEYISILKNQWPQLIITNFPVDGFDGLMALRIRKGLAPDTPMIILGETPSEEEMNALHDAGINDMIIWQDPGRLKQAFASLGELKEKQTKVREARDAEILIHQMQKNILHLVPNGIFLFEPDSHRLAYINPAFAGILGYSYEEAAGMGGDLFRILSHFDDYRNYLVKMYSLCKSGKDNAVEHDLRMKNREGMWRWIHTVNVVYKKSGNTATGQVLGTAQDITLRRELDDELSNAKLQAEEANHVKTVFLQNLSHYLRTPMNAIYGFTALLEEKILPSAVVQNYSGIIRENSEKLLNLINSLVDISLLETNNLPLFPEYFSLNKFFQELFDRCRKQIDTSGKSHLLLACQAVPPSVDDIYYFDKNRLQQIFECILNNSIQHTDSGYIEFGYDSSDNQWLVLYVKDTGTGIPLSRQKNLFEPFYGTEPNGTMHEGVGLSLAICKKIVELAHGKIGFESTPEEGTTIRFKLPRIGLTKNTEVKKYRNLVLDFDLQGVVVLVVEDNPESRFYYREVLHLKGIKVHEASTMHEAWKIFLAEPNIILVLLDIFLPDGNGLDLALRMKNRKKDVRIIAQTAYASQEDRTKCLGFGCDDYLSKPVEKEELLFRIAQQIKGTKRNGIFSGRFGMVSRNHPE